MCGCSDFDGPSVYHQALVKARRDRKCEECSGLIRTGQLYSRAKGCWDGQWQTYSECLPCFALRQAWHDTEGCWPSLGNLRDDVIECLRDEARCTFEEDFEEPSPPAPALNLAFGVHYRRHLGKMGPQRPRRAA